MCFIYICIQNYIFKNQRCFICKLFLLLLLAFVFYLKKKELYHHFCAAAVCVFLRVFLLLFFSVSKSVRFFFAPFTYFVVLQLLQNNGNTNKTARACDCEYYTQITAQPLYRTPNWNMKKWNLTKCEHFFLSTFI